jgi:adenosine deaminase
VPPTYDQIRSAPKVLLHDHLDGGLRPATVVELAREAGYDGLPTTDVEALERWFPEQAWSGSLERYLEPFSHTVAVMQTADALSRVAAECAEDLRDDGVVYAEVRFAPELHVAAGLGLDEVVAAVVRGFHSVSGIRVGTMVTAMRHAARSVEVAELAVRWRDRGVVGFDIAGAEAGFPPTRHLDAFQLLQRESAHFTIHAGEAFGLPSIWEALQWCHADRLGHGVRIMDDIEVDPESGEARLGRLAAYVRDTRVPLEMCPTSNVQTGAAPSVAEHPVGLLRRLRFRVTVNTDNRLVSGVTLSSELAACAAAFDWSWDDLRRLTLNAAKSAFLGFEDRIALMDVGIKPWYADVMGD